MPKIVLTVIVCLVFMAGPAAAQSKNGAFYGTVRDTSENLLPKVKVYLQNRNTRAVSRTTTNEAGEFRVEVPPGSYDLYAERQGFIPVMVPDLRLNADETIKKDVTLPEEKRGQNPLRRAPAQEPRTPLPEGAAPSR